MRVKLLKLSFEDDKFFLAQCADVGSHSASYGELGRIRLSKRAASMLLGWNDSQRFGAAEGIAFITVSVP